jgi:ribonuclease T2
MKTTITIAAAFAATASAALYSGESKLNHTCALVPDYLSCSANANHTTVDSCCVETFGGLFLQTQFWDVYTGYESQGQLLPSDSWTIHGLWPDDCNGSYTQYCDLSRQYDPFPSPNVTDFPRNGTKVPAYNGTDPITPAIQSFGRLDLLAYMRKYWVSQGSPDWTFWAVRTILPAKRNIKPD